MVETHEQAVKRGGKSRAGGVAFEKRVRMDLESKGFICDKWSNNVEFQKENSIEVSGKFGGPFGKIVPAKAKWNNFTKSMMMGKGGFPDFIAFRKAGLRDDDRYDYVLIGVEVKSNGILDKQERAKCCWLIENNIFSKIMIARKTKVKNRIVIEYRDFNMKDGK